MPTVLLLDPQDPSAVALSGFAAQRIAAHTTAHEPGLRAEEYVRTVMARMWARDPNLWVAVIVDEQTARVVGHVLAERGQELGGVMKVKIRQASADKGAEDARTEAVERAVKWAHQQQISHVELVTAPERASEWTKRLGFKRYRSVLWLPLDGEPDGG